MGYDYLYGGQFPYLKHTEPQIWKSAEYSIDFGLNLNFGRLHAVSVDVTGEYHVCWHGGLRESRLRLWGYSTACGVVPRHTLGSAHLFLGTHHPPKLQTA